MDFIVEKTVIGHYFVINFESNCNLNVILLVDNVNKANNIFIIKMVVNEILKTKDLDKVDFSKVLFSVTFDAGNVIFSILSDLIPNDID